MNYQTKTFRICEDLSAKKFLKACKFFNDGVCIYYKEHIPLILRDDINPLDNGLVTEIRSQNAKCFLTCICRSLSQNQDDFKHSCTDFDILLNNINDELPLCSIATGDFNARCSR